jgi:hypothetical protein
MSGTTARPRAGTVRTFNLALRVVGMKDLRALMRELDAGLPAELRDTNKRVVEQVLVPPVRAAAAAHRPPAGYNARTGHSTQHWADAVASVRAVASQTSSASEGYFFYPTIRAAVPRVIDAYAQALERFIARTVNANPPHQEG